jgi:D-alanine-D-alanine ligase-like ATP-grasp enzyme
LDIIEMPPKQPPYLLFEKFIETDIVRVKGNKLKHRKKTGWVEVTVGVLEEKNKIKVFNPSLTIAEGEVLTVEEKFQGGTGINLTPPPTVIVKKTALTRTKQLIGELTRKISINGYARIDCFMQVNTGDVLVIEINTLPGLTPSTVFFHQGLAEDPPLFPRQLLEKLIENKSNDKICLC